PVRLAPLAKLILFAGAFLVASTPFSHFLIFSFLFIYYKICSLIN
ncbi:hypothetical protein HMPREF9078_00012, partial [Capnocytophaga sp. oral taxon 380 str. F0488]